MPQLVTNEPAQATIEQEFSSLITGIRGMLEKRDLPTSNTAIGNLIGRQRLWIERRLLDAGEPTKVTVSLTDVFALRYTADKLESEKYRELFTTLKK